MCMNWTRNISVHSGINRLDYSLELTSRFVFSYPGLFDRYNGVGANPWNHIEWGQYYIRPMSSWTILLAALGNRYDAARGFIAFAPKFTPDNFKCFFSGAGGWGTFSQQFKGESQVETLEIKYGEIEIKELEFELPTEKQTTDKKIKIKIDKQTVDGYLNCKGTTTHIMLDKRQVIKAGQTLELKLRY